MRTRNILLLILGVVTLFGGICFIICYFSQRNDSKKEVKKAVENIQEGVQPILEAKNCQEIEDLYSKTRINVQNVPIITNQITNRSNFSDEEKEISNIISEWKGKTIHSLNLTSLDQNISFSSQFESIILQFDNFNHFGEMAVLFFLRSKALDEIINSPTHHNQIDIHSLIRNLLNLLLAVENNQITRDQAGECLDKLRNLIYNKIQNIYSVESLIQISIEKYAMFLGLVKLFETLFIRINRNNANQFFMVFDQWAVPLFQLKDLEQVNLDMALRKNITDGIVSFPKIIILVHAIRTPSDMNNLPTRFYCKDQLFGLRAVLADSFRTQPRGYPHQRNNPNYFDEYTYSNVERGITLNEMFNRLGSYIETMVYFIFEPV